MCRVFGDQKNLKFKKYEILLDTRIAAVFGNDKECFLILKIFSYKFNIFILNMHNYLMKVLT